MLYLFNAEEWGKLAPPQRIGFCRQLALRTLELSKTASGEAKEAYVRLAEHWDRLANELEKTNVVVSD
jgi:hypothetical protein